MIQIIPQTLLDFDIGGYGTRRTLLSWFTWKCKLVVVWIISNHQLFCDFICKNNMEKKEYFCFSRGINPILFSKVLMSKRRINQWQKKVIKTILFVVATALTLPWEVCLQFSHCLLHFTSYNMSLIHISVLIRVSVRDTIVQSRRFNVNEIRRGWILYTPVAWWEINVLWINNWEAHKNTCEPIFSFPTIYILSNCCFKVLK